MRVKSCPLVRLLLALSVLLISDCAKVSAPPGGPIDKTGPKIDSTAPPNGSSGIPRDGAISLRFSESTDRKSVEDAIFISPPFSEKVKYKWKNNILTIIPPDLLADSTTYVINIGSEISDLRQNKMDNSYVLAFSTGRYLDSGNISGTVFQGDKPLAGVAVALFDFPTPDDSTVFDSINPLYVTQSGKSGEYELDYLPDGQLFLMAFADKNKNRRFNFPGESFGLPDKPAMISGGATKPESNFYLIAQDTATISILSVTLTEDRLIKVRLSGKVDAGLVRDNLDRIRLNSSDSSMSLINANSLKEARGDIISNLTLFFRALQNGNYRLLLDSHVFGGKDDSARILESAEFNIDVMPDSTAPKIEQFSHRDKTVYPIDSIIEITFSEPINKNLLTDSSIIVRDSDSTVNDIDIRWPDDFRLGLYVTVLSWGKSYTVSIDENSVRDLSGNSAGDSLMTYRFNTYNADSLGSVSGTIGFGPTLDTTGIPYLVFSGKTKETIKIPVLNRQFDFSLPPGKYILRGFLDRNADGAQDPGSLFPFRYAETAMIYPDTIRVRARFETAGIEVNFK